MLGVIAVLIVLSSQALPPVARVLIDTLLGFWGGYAILTVIGLSEDIFGKRISGSSYLVGLFALGCAIAYCVSFVLLYLGTNIAVALLLGQNLHCTVSNAGNLTEVGKLGMGILCVVLANVFLTIEVFLIGFTPALFVPPVMVAWSMSRKYGKKIWGICAAILIINAAAFVFWLGFVSMMLSG